MKKARSVESSKIKSPLLFAMVFVLLAVMGVFVALNSRGDSTFELADGTDADADSFDLDASGEDVARRDAADLRVVVDEPEPSNEPEPSDEPVSGGGAGGSLTGVLEGLGSSRVVEELVSLSASEHLNLVLSSGLRNTFDDASPWAALPADEISYYDVTEPGPMPSGRPSAGIFHENCNFSHFAYDDSILFPDRPGLAHLHMFFGNSESNAYSTNESIRNRGASTCAHNELNRSSYWAPAVFTGDHRVLIPEIMNVYYTELDDNTPIVPFPEQFQMIEGSPMATEPPTGLSDGTWPLYWKCGWHEDARRGHGGTAGQFQGTIPYCDPGTYSHLEMGIQFGHCWDGVNDGTNGDAKSHISYPGDRAYASCPEGTKHVPAIRMRIHFKLDPSFGPSNEWYLSSDVRIDGGLNHSIIPNRGASIHADWFNGWDAETLKIAVDTCLNVNRDCWRNFGDARQAKLDPGQAEARTVAPYRGPLVADSSSLDALCPGRPDRTGPERALCDLSVMAAMADGG